MVESLTVNQVVAGPNPASRAIFEIMKKLQILTKLDDSKFNYLRGSTNERAQILYNNLWSMFDMEASKKTVEGIILMLDPTHLLCVADFGWTRDVSKSFYNHPKHRYFVKRNSRHLGMWKLDAEPSQVFENGDSDYRY